MGGGKEKKKTNAMLDEQNRQAQQEHNQYMGAVNTGLQGSQNRASDMYGSMYGGYQNFIQGGGDYKGNIGSGAGSGAATAAADPRFGEVAGAYRNFMGGGGVDTGAFNRFQGNLSEIGGTGGWSPERMASMDENIRGMKGIASDAEIANRMRGGGVFDEFAKTGGYSDRDIANIRSRAGSLIPAYYDTARNEAGRMAAVQGGYGPGQAALFSRMGRDQIREAARNKLDTEVGIRNQINQGRQWGGTNISNAEQAYQNARMQALTGAAGTESGMVNAIAQNRIGAANAGAGNEIGVQGLVQKGRMWGTEGLQGMAENDASRAAAAGAAGAANDRWLAEFNREGRQYGLEGMRSLYGARPEEVNMYLGANTAGRGLNYNNQGRIIDQRMSNNPQRDWFSTIGGLVGAAGGAMTGLGAMGFGRQGARAVGAV